MSSGAHEVRGNIEAVRDRLRMLLAAANCEATWQGENVVEFRHGTNLTQTAGMFPKRGCFVLTPQGGAVRLDWSVRSCGFAKCWLLLWAVLLCWLVFPPFIAYHVLVRKPEQFVRNLMAGL